MYPLLNISIHASAKEATIFRIVHISQGHISIHASAKEATDRLQPHMFFQRYFNPRLREGGDYLYRIIIICQNVISIHASAKEATTARNRLAIRNQRFQSTPPRRRRRRDPGLSERRDHNFNPRLREGGDGIPGRLHSCIPISIHASAKEATCRQFSIRPSPYIISIHASAKEATVNCRIMFMYCEISIHASAKEATNVSLRVQNKHSISIHASAKEATLSAWNQAWFISFQSTPPRRRRQGITNTFLGWFDFNPRLREGGD